jgi:hypothetical protein
MASPAPASGSVFPYFDQLTSDGARGPRSAKVEGGAQPTHANRQAAALRRTADLA